MAVHLGGRGRLDTPIHHRYVFADLLDAGPVVAIIGVISVVLLAASVISFTRTE